ncbi:oligomeric golgi complex component, COG2-domain-containing protein [Zopfochytrium polystomum]|nr:oligomeric golgi complex component, COG2-domain-containing protein [Zopfochytrium polystomum]
MVATDDAAPRHVSESSAREVHKDTTTTQFALHHRRQRIMASTAPASAAAALPSQAPHALVVAHGKPLTDTGPDAAAAALSPEGGNLVAAAFAADTFSASEFVAALLVRLPLPRLRAILNAILSDLKAELIDLINRDYADFINISTNLVGLDKIIQDVSEPLASVRVDVETLRDKVQSVMSDLELKLATRAELRNKKGVLQLLLSIQESLVKLEDLLCISDDGKTGSSDASLVGDAKLIERVAIEYNQFQFVVSKGKDLPFVESVEWRIVRIKDKLTKILSQELQRAFLAVMTSPEDAEASAALAQYLRTYVLIDKVKDAKAVFKVSVVDPFLSKAAVRPRGTDVTAEILTEFFGKVLGFVRGPCSKILEISSRVFRGSQDDLFTDVIFAELGISFSRNLFTAYNPGIPDQFHRNYHVAIGFLEAVVEGELPSLAALNRFRANSAYTEFLKKWNVSVYFQLRSKEIIGSFERVCQQPIHLTWDVKPEAGFILCQSSGLLDHLSQMWDDKVYIHSLLGRFWKLNLQLMQRYSLFWSEWHQYLSDALKKDKERNPGQKPSAETTSPRPDDALLIFTLATLYDLFALKQKLSELFASKIRHRLPPAAAASMSLIEESFHATLLDLTTTHLPDLRHKAVGILVSRSGGTLQKGVSDVVQKSRFARQAPTVASGYVAGIVRPLADALAPFERVLAATGAEGGMAEVAAIKTAAVDEIAARYHAALTKTLQDIEESEKYFRNRRNKQKTSSATATGGGEESQGGNDKIRGQILLDVRQFLAEVSAMLSASAGRRVEAESLSSCRELLRAVSGGNGDDR